MNFENRVTGNGNQDRRKARRTAVTLALVALAIYAAFIASGVIGR